MDMKISTKSAKTTARFSQNTQGQLLFTASTEPAITVTSALCFPWMKNNEFISIRDQHGNEVLLIEQLTDLDETSKHAVVQSLRVSTFMMTITAIHKITTEFEIRHWEVMTEQGLYKFQTQIDYWPQILNQQGILIHDVAGNIFYIADPTSLSEKSQRILWPYLD